MKKLIFILGVVGALTMACEKIEEGCAQEKPASALVFDFPDSIKIYESHPIKVRYVLDNNCGDFKDFEVSANGNDYEVKLMTKYEGCQCEPEFIEGETEYEIRIDFPGTYKFKFWLSNNDYDTYSLTVFE